MDIERKLEIELYTKEELKKILNGDYKKNKISSEELEYILLANLLPHNEISKDLKEYDSSCPKMDELNFAKKLSDKYEVCRKNIIKRICQVRLIDLYILSLNNNSNFVKRRFK